ncbi:MAG: cupin domain-containing protein [Kofleriaceae bacterium]
MKLLTIAAITALSFTAAANPSKPVKPADRSWVQPYGPKGPAFAFVEGKFNEKASFFIKLAPGADSGWHLHDEDYSGVVLQGSFTEQQAGDKAEVELTPGTYFVQPGKAVHRNGCGKTSECIVYIHFDANANSTPTTREGKPLTAQK